MNLGLLKRRKPRVSLSKRFYLVLSAEQPDGGSGAEDNVERTYR